MSLVTTEDPLIRLLANLLSQKKETPELPGILKLLSPEEIIEFFLKFREPKVAAEFYGISEGHLARMRCQGTGPEYTKLDANVRYQFLSLLAHAAARRRTSTADADTGEAA
jgi:hypothetical protein